MRVLFAITRGEIGGAQEHVRIIANGLLARGHEVALAVEEPSALGAWLSAAGATVHAWRSIERSINPLADLRARRELRDIVRSVRPDVLHLHSSKAGVLGRGLLSPPDGVVILTCHHAPYGPRRKWSHRVLARPVDEFTLPSLDGIISVGARDIPLLRKMAPAVPIRLVRNAVPAEGPPVGASTNHSALWVARLQHPKDPLLAIDAWERVVREVPDARLIVCGTGPLEDDVRRRAERGGARDRVEVAGRVPDLRPYQQQASVYFLATTVEGGTTMATLEAMTQGLVPVISDAGDAFLLEHARAGIVVRPGSAKAHADAVVQLFRRPDLVSAMRERALRFSREDWTPADMVESTIAFYEEVLAGVV